MASSVARYRDELEAVCRRYPVQRLERFDSAASGGLSPDTRDLKFLVMFEELEPAVYADACPGFCESLSTLFERRIELVSATAITNPFFLEDMQKNGELLFAA